MSDVVYLKGCNGVLGLMKLAQRLCLSARNDYLFRTASYELANYIQIFDQRLLGFGNRGW